MINLPLCSVRKNCNRNKKSCRYAAKVQGDGKSNKDISAKLRNFPDALSWLAKIRARVDGRLARSSCVGSRQDGRWIMDGNETHQRKIVQELRKSRRSRFMFMVLSKSQAEVLYPIFLRRSVVVTIALVSEAMHSKICVFFCLQTSLVPAKKWLPAQRMRFAY